MLLLQCPGRLAPLAFILPPKTGTRSLQRALAERGAITRRGRHGVDIQKLWTLPVVVATVRNPFDVLVSWYHYDAKGEKAGRSFDDWLNTIALVGKNSYLAKSTLPHAEHATRLLRFEDGLERVNVILEGFGVEPVTLPHVGRAESRKPYREYYTEATRREVEQHYRLDFLRYGYQF